MCLQDACGHAVQRDAAHARAGALLGTRSRDFAPRGVAARAVRKLDKMRKTEDCPRVPKGDSRGARGHLSGFRVNQELNRDLAT